jgi:hypothetical protein
MSTYKSEVNGQIVIKSKKNATAEGMRLAYVKALASNNGCALRAGESSVIALSSTQFVCDWGKAMRDKGITRTTKRDGITLNRGCSATMECSHPGCRIRFCSHLRLTRANGWQSACVKHAGK